MRLKLYLLGMVLFAIGCATTEISPTAEPVPTETAVSTPTQPAATPILPTTQPTAIPTATLIPAPTRVPQGILPAGIVYQTGNDIWQATAEGAPRLLFSSPALSSDTARVKISPQGDSLVVQDVRNETFLVDLASGERTVFDIIEQADVPGYMRDLTWWPGQPEEIIVLFSLDGDHYRSGLALANRDGTNWRVLADGVELWNDFDQHPTEAVIAATNNGKPLLLYANGRSQPIDLAQYNLPTDRAYFSPSWSPDGRLLAWHFADLQTTTLDSSTMGIALLDLESSTAGTLPNIITYTADGSLPPVRWSPDGRFFAHVDLYGGPTIIFQADGRELLRSEQVFSRWLSDSTRFLTTRTRSLAWQGFFLISVEDGTETAVELPIRIGATHLGPNDQILIRPEWDVPQLYFVYDATSNQLTQIEWPDGAIFLAWVP